MNFLVSLQAVSLLTEIHRDMIQTNIPASLYCVCRVYRDMETPLFGVYRVSYGNPSNLSIVQSSSGFAIASHLGGLSIFSHTLMAIELIKVAIGMPMIR